MVVVGDTVLAVPLVTAPIELLILPVPLLKTGINVVESPIVIVEDPGVSEVATGAATTVMVILVDEEEPKLFVTVR